MTANILKRLPVRSILSIGRQFKDTADKAALDLIDAGYDVAEVPGGYVCNGTLFADDADGVVSMSIKRSAIPCKSDT